MNDDHPIRQLLQDARAFAPFGEANPFGFETRLRAALAAAGSDLSVTDWIARFSWRFSAACLPVILGFAIFLTMQHHDTLPEGVGSLVAHWSEFLPLDI